MQSVTRRANPLAADYARTGKTARGKIGGAISLNNKIN